MSIDPMRSLFVLGCSHNEAPLEVRERFALSPEAIERLRADLLAVAGLRECLVLGTCNRMEIYGLAQGESLPDRLESELCRLRGVDRDLLADRFFRLTNLDAIQHLLELAAGLRSQMVGETEILGQLKQAYAAARAARATGPILNRLFEKSFQAAKSARSQTGVTRGQISVGNVAVDLAERIFGRLHDSRVLLIGGGEVGQKTAQALRSKGAGDIAVTSRTFERAHALAHTLGGAAIDFADFTAQIGHYDILVCATAAPGAILDKSAITRALRPRPERPLFVIDLALPRDVDPAVETLDNVYLYNLDDLSAIANENLAQRKAEIERARAILSGHAWSLWLQLRRRSWLDRRA